jgi:hypothetical protein
MLWYTMGWPLFIVALVGIVVAIGRMTLESLDKVLRQEFLSKPLSSEVIPLTFLVVFFMATGYFQVKFPRYLLPLYPLAFMFGASLFGNTFRLPARRSVSLTPSAPVLRVSVSQESSPAIESEVLEENATIQAPEAPGEEQEPS